MLNSKLYYIISSFTEDELREFGKFINSPFYNTNKKLIKLYEEMKKSKFDFKSPSMKLENIFSQICPGKKYNNGILRNLFSDMNKLAEDFLGICYLKSHKIEWEKCITKQIVVKNLDKLFEKRIDDAIDGAENSELIDEKNFLQLYQLRLDKRNFRESRIPLGKSLPIYNNISSEINHIILFFVTVMMKEYFHILSYRKQLNFKHNLTLYKEVMSIVEREKLSESSILIRILYNFLILYEADENDELYYKLKTMILRNKRSLIRDDFKDFCTEIYNYAVRRRLKGIDGFLNESIDMLKLLVKENILITKGYLSAHSYINLASKAFFEKEFEWGEKFIYEYKDKVNPEHRENAYNYIISVLYYTKGSGTEDHEEKREYLCKAQEHLSMVKSEDFFYMLKIKKLLVKIYYELEDFVNLNYTIDSFVHYLNNNESIPGKLKEGSRNFVNASKNLLKLNEKYTKFDKDFLKKEISASENIDFKNWLLEKAEELGKRSKA
jgi:hypothetical protein